MAGPALAISGPLWRSVPTRSSFRPISSDLSMRLANRIQLSSDTMDSYVNAVEAAFGADVDYGQAVKFYEAEPTGPGRYPHYRELTVSWTTIEGAAGHALGQTTATAALRRQLLRHAGTAHARRLSDHSAS